jgi:hypothetical protein
MVYWKFGIHPLLSFCKKPEEAAELCKHLEAMKIDFVELSGGTYEENGFKHAESAPRESTKLREAFFTVVSS